MKKQYISLLALAFVLFSCEKNFEVTSSASLSGSQAAELVEQDPEFLTSYVNGFYSWMVEYGGNHDQFGHMSCLYNLDMMGLDIAVCGSLNFGLYDINHDYGQYDWSRPYLLWNTYYTLIKKCNEVIDFFGEEDPENASLKGYLGQAYALRAFSYYYLIQIFQDTVKGEGSTGSVFNSEAPAVPIVYAIRDGKTQDEITAKSGRNTLADLCEQIEIDLAAALSLLDGFNRGADKNQVNYQVAQGIAARYYLLTQQWDKALEAATAAQEGFDLMDNDRLHAGFMEINDGEVMWGFNHNTETSTVYASFFSHLSNDSPGYGGIGQSVHCIDRSLYDAIPDTDYRKSLFNGPEGDEDAALTGATLPYASRKFGYDPNWCQDYVYMRKAEMILICAEAHARLNDGSASTCLSELMAKRDPSWSSSSVTLDDVLLQRRIELWGEGFEYFDLRRNGLGINRNYEGTNHLAINRYAFPAHAKSWNFQIPRQEMQNNLYITEDEQNKWISGTAE